ncbi:uncharacterized protein O3C94_015688 [Discoglossus pictus]
MDLGGGSDYVSVNYSDKVTSPVFSESDHEEETNMRSPREIKEEGIPVNISEDVPMTSNMCEEHQVLLFPPDCVREDFSISQGYMDTNQSCVKQQRGETSFVYYDCGKEFNRNTNPKRLKRVHTGDNPYECSDYEKCFSTPADLNTQEQPYTEDQKYVCSECGKGFSRASSLKGHKRSHTGERPFPSSECGKCFSHALTLNNHKRTHIGERTFSCSDCVEWRSGEEESGGEESGGEEVGEGQDAGGRLRAPNYSHRENVTLLYAVRERPAILVGRREVKPGPKAQAWKEVAAAVTAVGKAERDVRSVKHRFDDMRAKVRRKMAKEASQAAAPNGPQVTVKYNEWERVAKDLISQLPAPGTSGLVDQQDPASMSGSDKVTPSVLSESDHEEETNMRSPREIKEEEIPVNISEGPSGVKPPVVAKDEQEDLTIRDQQQVKEEESPVNIREDVPMTSNMCEEHQVLLFTGYNPYECSDYEKCFSTSADLSTQEQLYTEDQKYGCSECGKCFSRASSLKAHKRSHTGDRPFPSSECGKCFSHSSTLNSIEWRSGEEEKWLYLTDTELH